MANIIKNKIIEYFNKLDKDIGLNNLGLVHLNDSKNKLGSRKDRHIGLGKGNIGYKNIKIIFNFLKMNNIPMIIESPYDEYMKEIPKLLDN